MPNSAKRLSDGRIYITCDACGSRGVSHVVARTRVSNAANDKALENHRLAGESMYEAHEAQRKALVGIKAKMPVGDPRIKEIDDKLTKLDADLEARHAALEAKRPKDLSYTTVDQCPWCTKKFDGIKIEELAA